MQDQMIFRNVPASKQEVKHLKKQYPGSELFLETKDGHKLHGWLLPKQNSDILNICFNGNGEEATGIAFYWLQNLNGAILTFNYRGYGKSTGQSSQKKLFEDSLLIYEMIKNKFPQYKKIFIVGRSLGTGVACYLATQKETNGLLLINPYDSLLNISQDKYPIFPVSLCLKHPFNSLELADKIEEPSFFIVAQNDKLLPPANALNLFEHLNCKKEIHYVAHAGHNNIFSKPEFTNLLKEFYTYTSK